MSTKASDGDPGTISEIAPTFGTVEEAQAHVRRYGGYANVYSEAADRIVVQVIHRSPMRSLYADDD